MRSVKAVILILHHYLRLLTVFDDEVFIRLLERILPRIILVGSRFESRQINLLGVIHGLVLVRLEYNLLILVATRIISNLRTFLIPRVLIVLHVGRLDSDLAGSFDLRNNLVAHWRRKLVIDRLLICYEICFISVPVRRTVGCSRALQIFNILLA